MPRSIGTATPAIHFGTPRPLTAAWLGVNVNCAVDGGFASRPELGTAVATLGVGTARFPGGSAANVWQWAQERTGTMTTPFHLAEFVALVQPAAVLVVANLCVDDPNQGDFATQLQTMQSALGAAYA